MPKPHIFNPRKLLREGSLEMMLLAHAGELVLLRVGDVTGEKPTILPERNITSREEWQPVRDRVFRLVELSAEDVAILQKLNKEN